MSAHCLFWIVEGLCTALHSSTSTDYPNSHKLILVIGDGMAKGAWNTLTTPESYLSMMADFVVAPHGILMSPPPVSQYIQRWCRFCDYDDATVECSKEQHELILPVTKYGNSLDAGDIKQGNYGKHDCQIVLMAFLQVIFEHETFHFDLEGNWCEFKLIRAGFMLMCGRMLISRIPCWGWSVVWCITNKSWIFAAKQRLWITWRVKFI